jgi:predicted permease
MKVPFGLWRRLRHLRDERDLEDELRVHLELLTEDNAAGGLDAAEAARRARVQLGSTRVVAEKVRDQELITILEGWYRDLALGVRALRKSPVFCLSAILTLALGIGANTAIFTLLYGLLLRSLPVADAHRLVRVSLTHAGYRPNAPETIPYRMLQQVRHRQSSFTDISAWIPYAFPLQDDDGSLRQYIGDLVSGNAFAVLGMRPWLGRLISPADDVRGGAATVWPAVLSYGFWKDHCGGSPEILGKRIRLSNVPAIVIGVAPPDFDGVWPGMSSKLYLPIQAFSTLGPGGEDLDSPASLTRCLALGRLRPGTPIGQANAEAAAYQKQLLDLIPLPHRNLPYYREATIRVYSARTGFPSFFGRTYSEPLYLMQGLVAIVLMLCCINVGGLMMSNVHARRHEFAVRMAMGAGRWRLVRQYLAESFVLAAGGAALGAAVAWAGNDFLLRFFRHPMAGEWMSIEPDRAVLFVTGLCALVTTAAFGILPALNASRTDPGFLLKSRTAGARGRTAGRAFVPVQVALSLALVTIATLLSQSLSRIRGERTGFDVEHVTIQTPPFNLLHKAGDVRLDVYQRMVDRIDQMPGVESAAVTWMTPMTGIQATAAFQAAGGPHSPEDPHMAYNAVGPGYFRTMKTRIFAGREFLKNEREPAVCVVNQSAANFLFPHQQAVGGYVRSTDAKQFPEGVTCRVIGVAEDAKFATLRESPPRTIYFPLTGNAVERAVNLVFLINSATKAQSIAAYRKALAEIAPSIPLVLFATLGEQMDAALGSQSLITSMSNFFGGLALLLSAIGLYGLLASSVVQRTGDIGVRIALGARRGRVLWMILSDALRLAGAGMLLGCLLLFPSVRLVEGMLYGVSAFDPSIWIAAAAVLTAVALVAAFIPALRAASVDPMQALRAE